MTERDRYIAGVPCWVDTRQPDPGAAVDFYRGLFGWEFEDVAPVGSGPHYFIARIRGGDVAAIGSLPEGAPQHASWNTYVWVESADETAEKVWAAGGTCVVEPFEIGDAGRTGVFADPEGAVFSVWQARAHRGARIVNEPGSVNFNGLHVRDLDRARAFYGSVFGWRTLSMGPGADAWTLPGYGDHLEVDRPGMRREFAQMGAPAGFEDVVATLSPIPAEQAGATPHWDVTFAVDDADAIADRATELGGRVVVPPFDAPWVRMAVVADPQGATLIASRFVPDNRDLGNREPSAAAAA